MHIQREVFLQTLESVQPGLSPKEILEQSSCFIFRDGEVFTFDDEIACRATSGLDKSFNRAVPGAKMLEILRKLPEDELEVTPKEAELLFTGKGRKLAIRLEAEIVLPVESIEQPKDWTPLHEDFTDAIQVVITVPGKMNPVLYDLCASDSGLSGGL